VSSFVADVFPAPGLDGSVCALTPTAKQVKMVALLKSTEKRFRILPPFRSSFPDYTICKNAGLELQQPDMHE
jgi:hypothetical protein